jgi:hypothetical protein
MGKSNLTNAAWNTEFSNAIEQACERAIMRLFPPIRDEAIKQALAQGFSAGVDWCFSEQFDADVAKAALALGVSTDEAATGALRKAR